MFISVSYNTCLILNYVYINFVCWVNYEFGGQSTSGVNRLMGVNRLFLGVKRLHLLGVKRLGGQTTGYLREILRPESLYKIERFWSKSCNSYAVK